MERYDLFLRENRQLYRSELQIIKDRIALIEVEMTRWPLNNKCILMRSYSVELEYLKDLIGKSREKAIEWECHQRMF